MKSDMMAAFPVPRKTNVPQQRGLLAKALDLTNKSEAPFKLSGRYDNVDSVPPLNFDERSDPLTSKCTVCGPDESISDNKVDGHRFVFSRNAYNESSSSTLGFVNNNLIGKRTEADRGFFLNCDDTRNKFGNLPPQPVDVKARRPSSDATPLQCIHEDDLSPVTSPRALNSTQQLRSGFFRTIKRQYPLLESMGMSDTSTDSGHGDSLLSDDGLANCDLQDEKKRAFDAEPIKKEDGATIMSTMARRRLAELRTFDPKNVDVATGLQWIRLELHEMREQDKALFLQLIKLHSTIKELRSEMNCSSNDSDCSLEDINDAASLLWPRYNSLSRLPSFSSSDGARFLKGRRHPELRRGFSLQHQRPKRFESYFSVISSSVGERTSCRSSTSSVRSATAC